MVTVQVSAWLWLKPDDDAFLGSTAQHIATSILISTPQNGIAPISFLYTFEGVLRMTI
jgi:hypothetical protein